MSTSLAAKLDAHAICVTYIQASDFTPDLRMINPLAAENSLLLPRKPRTAQIFCLGKNSPKQAEEKNQLFTLILEIS